MAPSIQEIIIECTNEKYQNHYLKKLQEDLNKYNIKINLVNNSHVYNRLYRNAIHLIINLNNNNNYDSSNIYAILSEYKDISIDIYYF